MISVIMSAYKEKREWLEQAILSILNQTYKNFELIITLDNPKNIELKQLIEEYSKKDNRIIFIYNKENIGLTNCLNNMLKIVKGDYIARMDADDISLSTRFEEQLKYMQNNNLDICGANIIQFYKNENLNEIKNPSSFKNIKKYIYIKNCVAHPTFLVKRKVYDRLNGYNEVPTCEDYDFLLRAINAGYTIGNIPKFLLKYRLSPNSVSRKNLGKQVVLSEYISKYYKNNKDGLMNIDLIMKYMNTKRYKIKATRYDKYCYKKNQMLKNKKKNKIKYIIILLSTIFYFDLLLKNIFEKYKLKKLLKVDG